MHNYSVRWYTVVDKMSVGEICLWTKCRRRNIRRRIVVERIENGQWLDLFDELETDRPLLNNPDLDPDENYFTVRPNHCTYKTISSLTPVRSQISSLLSIMSHDRPLLNNPVLDPDENYVTVRPNHCTYNTISSLTPVRSQICSLLSIMHIDCRSILSKPSDIERILRFLSIDIHVLAVSETFLDYTTARSIHIPGYNCEFQCRTTSRGGGVGFF